MNQQNQTVLSNIIVAVESHGQVYPSNDSDFDWDQYTPPFTNSDKEYTITVGPWQAYGPEAQEIFQYIHDKYPGVFRACDTTGKIAQKLSTSWTDTAWNPDSVAKSGLIAMLRTDAGHEASRHVYLIRAAKYLANAEAFGVKNTYGQMMWAECQHLAGLNPTTRVFNRCGGNFSLDNIMAALKKDQAQTGSNSVSSAKYWSRHTACYSMIKVHAIEESGPATKDYLTVGDTGEEVRTMQSHLVACGFCGCNEKNIDGDFGGKTLTWVRALQKAASLPVDGVYGKASKAALDSYVSLLTCNIPKSITAAQILSKSKEIADFVRTNRYSYGDAPFLPAVSGDAKIVSCDRFVDMVLFALGWRDVQNTNVDDLPAYLASKGFTRNNDYGSIAAGDIIFQTGHTFILGNNCGNLWQRYDCGSPERILNVQPFTEIVDQSKFVCSYRFPNLIKEASKTVGHQCTKAEYVGKLKYYEGMEEKASDANLESFHENVGSNNYQKFEPEIANGANGDYWCDYFRNACAYEACGNSIEWAAKVMRTTAKIMSYGSTVDSAQQFKNAGSWNSVPMVGDAAFFYSTSLGRIAHTGGVISVNPASKTFSTMEGNTSSTAYSRNGGCVASHTYSYESIGGTNRVNGFGRPLFADSGSDTTPKDYLSEGDQGQAVIDMQTELIACGYSCGDSGADGSFGPASDSALKRFQRDHGLTQDGAYGAASKAALDAAYKALTHNTGGNSNPNQIEAGQKFLNEYYPEVVKTACGSLLDEDGAYGNNTRNAALAVWKDIANRKHGAQLTLTSHAFGDSCLQAAGGMQVQPGSDGTLVVIYELILAAKGYYTGDIDGSFGDGMKAATIRYQKDRNLSPDSVIGPNTAFALFNY